MRKPPSGLGILQTRALQCHVFKNEGESNTWFYFLYNVLAFATSHYSCVHTAQLVARQCLLMV